MHFKRIAKGFSEERQSRIFDSEVQSFTSARIIQLRIYEWFVTWPAGQRRERLTVGKIFAYLGTIHFSLEELLAVHIMILEVISIKIPIFRILVELTFHVSIRMLK